MHADDEEEFQVFVRSRWPKLVRTAYLLTGDAHLAEDVAQTALTKAYRSWSRVQRSDNPDAYVRRILVTSHKDRFRKRRVAERLTDALPDTADRRDPLSASDQRQELMAALARLPVRQRAVVVLRYWEDIPEAEVARTLGCSVGTVKSQASRALAALRRVLRDEPPVFAAYGRRGEGEQ
ncbi:SigE family RNA polymerase sigma factor [Streptomyces sp. YIM 98790]|uniref:SigE family RNA polymerase sigma factor n=1 Tax=Streptomyces sp. YIM 98790 TaxID=2689077 RepID=UPI001407C0F5|nr:SigE family RNA polymerase sigma factor [Streptomyces sp. YIM 98790]